MEIVKVIEVIAVVQTRCNDRKRREGWAQRRGYVEVCLIVTVVAIAKVITVTVVVQS